MDHLFFHPWCIRWPPDAVPEIGVRRQGNGNDKQLPGITKEYFKVAHTMFSSIGQHNAQESFIRLIFLTKGGTKTRFGTFVILASGQVFKNTITAFRRE